MGDRLECHPAIFCPLLRQVLSEMVSMYPAKIDATFLCLLGQPVLPRQLIPRSATGGVIVLFIGGAVGGSGANHVCSKEKHSKRAKCEFHSAQSK